MHHHEMLMSWHCKQGQTAKPGRLQARANSAMLLYMRLMQVQLLLRLQGPKESIHHLWRDLQ